MNKNDFILRRNKVHERSIKLMRIHMDTTPNAEGYFKSRVSEVQLRPIVNGPVVPNTLQSFLSPDGGSSSRLC